MGSVFHVSDPGTGKEWAAKLLRPVFSDIMYTQRFRREFRVLSKLDYPGVVSVGSMNREKNYFLMELVPGETLKYRILRQKAFRSTWITDVLQWGIGICNTLDYLHSNNIVHRDLKPSNIMILPQKSSLKTKLLDFGLIHVMDSDSDWTTPSTLIGSAMYMSPEQCRGEKVDPRSDLYSLGVVLFEAFSGYPLFDADNFLALIAMHQFREPVSLQKRNSAVPEHLDRVVMKLLSKRPQDRPLTARETAGLLRQCLLKLTEEPVRVPGKSTAPPIGPVSAVHCLFEPEFIGRRELLHTISETILQLTPRDPKMIIIHGDRGMGKSRFLNAVRGLPECKEALVLTGDFRAGKTHLFGGISRAMARLLNDPPRNVSDELRTLIRKIAQPYGSVETDSIPGTREAAAACVAFLQVVCENRPIIFLLDNLHFAGKHSLDLILDMIQEIRLDNHVPPPVFLFIATQMDGTVSEHVPDFETRLQKFDAKITLQLPPLQAPEVQGVAESMLGNALDDSALNRLVDYSGGVPLFVTELLKCFWDQQYMEKFGNHWRFVRGKGVIPDKISRLMERKFENFTKNEWRLARLAALLGSEFSGNVLEQVSDLKEDQFLDTFESLLRKGVFEELPHDPDGYRFRNMLIRDFIEQGIPRYRKQRLHRQIAEISSRLYETGILFPVERIAYHFEAGLQFRQAYRFRWIAADEARKMNRFEALKAHLERAEDDLHKAGFDPEEKCFEEMRLSLESGVVARRRGDTDKARVLLNQAKSAARKLNNKEYYARALMQVGSIYGIQGKYTAAASRLSEALTIFQELKNVPFQVDCLTNLGAAAASVEKNDTCREYFLQAWELAQCIDDPQRRSRAALNAAIHFTNSDDFEKALFYYDEALKIARAMKDRRMAATTLYGIAGLHFKTASSTDTYHRIIHILDEAVSVLQTTGDRGLMAGCLYLRAKAKRKSAIFEEDDLRAALEISREMSIVWLTDLILSEEKAAGDDK